MPITQSHSRPIKDETTAERAEREEMFTIHPEILGTAGPMPRRVEDGAPTNDPAVDDNAP